MTDLAGFLLARIAEDEAAACEAEGFQVDTFPDGALRQHVGHIERLTKLPAIALDFACPTCHVEPGAGCLAMTPPHHAPRPASAMHGTRRDLALVEARRRFGDMSHRGRWPLSRVMAECEAKRLIVRKHWETDCPYVLRALALPYADHFDYREEWRP